jgi:hypothetical protein
MTLRQTWLPMFVIVSMGCGVALAGPSCSEEIGPAKARVLVARCIEVSPATHPPCNAVNPCSLIVDEIRRSCRFLGRSPETPGWCADYTR